MKQVYKNKEQCYHVFEDSSGNEVVEECSLEDYRALALSNAGQPKREGLTWKFSIESIKFDTPSGFLEKGCYWDAGDGTYCVSLDNERKFRNFNVSIGNLTGGELKTAALAELQRMGVTLDAASRLELKNIR
jgi:hypothetical protein